MEKYNAKESKISFIVIKFLFFLAALIVLPYINFLSKTMKSVWFYLLGVFLVLAIYEIILYFKKVSDYIEFTEDGLKIESKWGAIQECKYTDIFKYYYRRKKIKSILVRDDKNKGILIVNNRYEIDLSEVKDKVERRKEIVNMDVLEK